MAPLGQRLLTRPRLVGGPEMWALQGQGALPGGDSWIPSVHKARRRIHCSDRSSPLWRGRGRGRRRGQGQGMLRARFVPGSARGHFTETFSSLSRDGGVGAALLPPTLLFLPDSFKSRELLTFSGHLRVRKQSLGLLERLGKEAFIGLCLKPALVARLVGAQGRGKLGISNLGTLHFPSPNKSKVDVVESMAKKALWAVLMHSQVRDPLFYANISNY